MMTVPRFLFLLLALAIAYPGAAQVAQKKNITTQETPVAKADQHEAYKELIKKIMHADREDRMQLMDSLEILTSGIQNRVKLGPTSIKDSSTLIINGKVAGKIDQSGENNQVEINSNEGGEGIRKVTITQQGKNNSVKINSNNH